MDTRHDKKRATSKRYEIPPCTVRNLCAPLSAHTIAHARLPAALAPTGAAGFHFGHGSRSQRHFFAIVCGRTTRLEANRGLVEVFAATMKAACDRFYVGSFPMEYSPRKAARVNRILPRFSRARKGASTGASVQEAEARG